MTQKRRLDGENIFSFSSSSSSSDFARATREEKKTLPLSLFSSLLFLLSLSALLKRGRAHARALFVALYLGDFFFENFHAYV